VKGDHPANGPLARRPRFPRIAREPAVAVARTSQHDLRIRRIDRNLSAQGILEIADGREGLAPVTADFEPAT